MRRRRVTLGAGTGAAAISHITATGPVPFDKNVALENAFKHLGLYERNNTQRREDLRIVVKLMG